MKLLFSCLTLIALVCTCSLTKITANNVLTELKQNELTLVYKSHTRGYFEEISICETSLILFNDHKKLNPIRKTISKKEWSKCKSLAAEIELKSIDKLTAPSNLRYTDRVAYAQLMVIQEGDSLKSSGFDHKNPPLELKFLVEHILSLKEN